MKKAMLAIGILAVLGVGYYALSPLFRTKEVRDALPEGTATAPSGGELLPQEGPAPQDEPAYPVTGTFAHPAEGTVRIIDTVEGTFIRYENFETINGPDLHVYLVKDLDVKEFVDLGPIRGTSGNINYAVPEGVDISDYNYVIHWCVPFKVLFNYAEIK